MNVFRYLLLLLLVGILGACTPPSSPPEKPSAGLWRFGLHMNQVELPFHAELSYQGSDPVFHIRNAEERILVDEVEHRGDSLIIHMPIFNTVFYGKMTSPTQVSGVYQDYSRGDDYVLPFEAVQGDSSRFSWPEGGTYADLGGRWRMEFSPATDTAYPGVGVFQQVGNTLTGTILTETGDYRYLEGSVRESQVRLSAFDGSHAFLFHGNLRGDSLFGAYYSGKHWEENWVAIRDEHATLRDPDDLTFLKPGYDRIAFRFPNMDSTMVSLEDPQYQGKPVIVQLMGSWCPNCMDESKYFAELHRQYGPKGLEIIALAFERQTEFQAAQQNMVRLRQRLGIEYDILLAGTSSKVDAAAALPMLNHVLAFPTSIFIDKQGNIRKIHTGFNGPSTGALYTRFVDQSTQLVEKMLAE